MTTLTSNEEMKELEADLDDFDRTARLQALRRMAGNVSAGGPRTHAALRLVNLHAHTFFSYNPYGYSPSHYAWLARRAELEVAGIVDFDVLDGVDEFHEAGRILGLRTCASIESRVYVPEFADKVINSPGEPGIAYHMGVGFVSSRLPEDARPFLAEMRTRAAARTRDLVERVNAHLDPVTLDFEKEVLPLTPNANATERHVCDAYARKAAGRYSGADLKNFWRAKLGELPADIDLPAGPALQALLRTKTMKRGGVGYVHPGPDAFPLMSEMNRFSLQCGAIPTLAWLDGMSDGEKEMERLIDVGKASGVAAINIIPDRNFTPGAEDEKLQNLYDLVALAEAHQLPVLVGTEMNSPGQKFVDDLECPELSPLSPVFLKGAHIVYAHTVLQRHAGMGYLSAWAGEQFSDTDVKNQFFKEFGYRFRPGDESRLAGVHPGSDSSDVLDCTHGANT